VPHFKVECVFFFFVTAHPGPGCMFFVVANIVKKNAPTFLSGLGGCGWTDLFYKFPLSTLKCGTYCGRVLLPSLFFSLREIYDPPTFLHHRFAHGVGL